MNGWIDDSDLPKLQSIELGSLALGGDHREKQESDYYPPYRNTLIMRSEID